MKKLVTFDISFPSLQITASHRSNDRQILDFDGLKLGLVCHSLFLFPFFDLPDWCLDPQNLVLVRSNDHPTAKSYLQACISAILAKTGRVEWWQLSCFPAKMILVHMRAIFSIEEISFSQSFSSYNLKVSIIIHVAEIYTSEQDEKIPVFWLFTWATRWDYLAWTKFPGLVLRKNSLFTNLV